MHNHNGNEYFFKYGKQEFLSLKDFNGREIAYTIIPCSYLAQDIETKEVFIFKTFKELEDYFKGIPDGSK